MIQFRCPRCNRQLDLDDRLAGTLGRCPECGKEIQIPGGEAAAPVISFAIDDGAAPDLASITIDPDKKAPPPVIFEEPARRESLRGGAGVFLAPFLIAGGVMLGAIIGAGTTFGVMSAAERRTKMEVDVLGGYEAEAFISSQRFVTHELPPGNVTEFSIRYESNYTGEGVYAVSARATTRTPEGDTQFVRYQCRVMLDANGQWDVADLAVEEDI
ncbi:MAG: hypothetical protein AAB353_08565 [Candidatus Hydrogenedentota bacterium]